MDRSSTCPSPRGLDWAFGVHHRPLGDVYRAERRFEQVVIVPQAFSLKFSRLEQLRSLQTEEPMADAQRPINKVDIILYGASRLWKK
jgi:hypothetical protein